MKLLSILFSLLIFISCSTIENATSGETENVDNDTTMVGTVTNEYLFNNDTTINETAVIIEVSIDSNTFKFLEDTLGQTLPSTGDHKVACLKKFSVLEVQSIDSTLYIPINFPAKYMDSTMLNNYVEVTANPCIIDIPNYNFIKIIKLNTIKDYSPSNLIR